MKFKPLILIILVLAFSLLPIIVSAMMDLTVKECLQRGYEIKGDLATHTRYCVFPDGNKCLLEDFNNGSCGQEYKIEDYCVQKGNPVWDGDKCCEGTIAYIKPNFEGQKTCQSISIFERGYNQLRYNIALWFLAGLIIIIFFLVFIGRLLYKRLKR